MSGSHGKYDLVGDPLAMGLMQRKHFEQLMVDVYRSRIQGGL
jgi:hypothetical protein